MREPSQSPEYIDLMIDTILISFILPQKIILKVLVSILSILKWAAQSVNYAPEKKRETCKIFTYNNQSLRWGISHLSSLFHKRPNSTYYGGSSRLISWKVGR